MSTSYCCPKCGSDHTQKVGLAYSTSASKSLGLSIGAARVGKSTGFGGAITSTESSSLLSQSLKPPVKKTLYWKFCFFAIFTFSAIYYPLAIASGSSEDLAGSPEKFVWWFELILVFLAWRLLTSLVESFKFNREQYPKFARNWMSEFICLRCGERFEPK